MRNIPFLTKNLIAHRGIHNDKIKENTIEAFEQAMERKMAIEIDIQLTKDNVVVVHHDSSLIRLTGINKKISSLTYSELHKICNWIPTLSQTLKFVNGKVPLLIELKSYNKNYRLEEESTKLLDNYSGDFAIQSFSPKTLYWFKNNRPKYIRGQLLTIKYNYNFITNIIYRHMLFNLFTKPDFISYNVKGLPNKIISRKREKDIILGWTIKDKKQIEKYKDYCDNFIVENML